MPLIPWWKKLTGTITIHTYDFNFGIVVPCPTGFRWEQQTNGVMCTHIAIEGVFIPLPYPRKIIERLQTANYYGIDSEARKAWKSLKRWLKKNLYFEFEEVDFVKGYPPNQEGLQWIKITRYDDQIDERFKLVGKTVALYYPNSD